MDIDIAFIASLLGWFYVLLLVCVMGLPQTKALNVFKLCFLSLVVGLFVYSHYWLGAAVWLINMYFPISYLLKEPNKL